MFYLVLHTGEAFPEVIFVDVAPSYFGNHMVELNIYKKFSVIGEAVCLF